MGIIDASLTRYVNGHPELRPTPMVEPSVMSDAEVSAKLDELDDLISSLQDELAETPNARWETPGARYRLECLIRYTARRHLLSLAS